MKKRRKKKYLLLMIILLIILLLAVYILISLWVSVNLLTVREYSRIRGRTSGEDSGYL